MVYEDFNPTEGLQMVIPRNSPDLKEPRLIVKRVYDRKKASGDGTFPCIEFCRPDKTRFEVPVWTRDARPLIKAWGLPVDDAWLDKECIMEVKSGNVILTALEGKQTEIPVTD